MNNRRFIVVIENATYNDARSFKKYTEQQDFDSWNWFDNVWLLVISNQEITTSDIRDKIRDMTDRKSAMVLEVSDIDWSTFGPKGKDGISHWLKKVWTDL